MGTSIRLRHARPHSEWQLSRLLWDVYGLRLDATRAAMITMPSATPISRPRTNCHIVGRPSPSPDEHRRKPLYVRWRHVGELQPDVEFRRRANVQFN